MRYKHLFFDLDHTLWDFETNAKRTLEELYHSMQLAERGVDDLSRFHTSYSTHNNRLWERYRNGYIKTDELRWKRMWHTLLDFKIGDEKLARELSGRFIDLLPQRNALFPHTIEMLTYLKNKQYRLHMITNGFDTVQHQKIKNAGLDSFFEAVVTSECSNSLKPQVAIFEYAFAKTGALPQESIMIGDNLEADIQGAINAGIDQVFVNHINETPAIQPTYTVYSLKELENIF